MSVIKCLGVQRCQRCGVQAVVWLCEHSKRRFRLCIGCLPNQGTA